MQTSGADRRVPTKRSFDFMNKVTLAPLTASVFAPFGDVLDASGEPDKWINQGLCGRHHDLAAVDFSDGRAGISVFDAVPRALPYTLKMMERHPAGSQAFLPMTQHPFIITVAPDAQGRPDVPHAFLTAPGQGINLHRGVWHGVLTPLSAPGLFAVFDRIGAGENLEEYWFAQPYMIVEA